MLYKLNYPTKHDVKDIIKTIQDYLQILQTKTSRHQNVNDLEIIYYLRFVEDIMETCLLRLAASKSLPT